LLGLALSLSGLAFVGLRILGATQKSPEALIHLKYGGLLVNVYERNLTPASMLVEVTNIDELAKLAERHNTVILHMALDFIHSYIVQCNGLTYRYVFSTGRRGMGEIEPPRQEVINYVSTENTILGPEGNEEDLFRYVINNNRTTRTEVTDTVIMKKIRL
jgi:hypothetical protein